MVDYITDSDVLINLSDHFNPNIFHSLWTNLLNMIENEEMASLSLVYNELGKKRQEETWNDIRDNYNFFLKPTPEETIHLPNLESFETFQKHGLKSKVWADPFLICYAIEHDCAVLTQESIRKFPQRKIPYVCKELGVDCLNLDEFMIQNNWNW